jgi:hypothetical protein
MEITEYIGAEAKYVNEDIKIERVKNIIIDWAKENKHEFICFLRYNSW